MKRMFLIAIAVTLIQLTSSAEWEEIRNGIDDNTFVHRLLNVEDTLFAGTSTGIYRTINYGENWEKIFEKETDYLFLYQNIIFAANSIGFFKYHYSLDYGKTWIEKSAPQRIHCMTINNGKYFLGAYNGIYESSDDGNTWIKLNVTEYPINDMFSYKNNIYVTANGGIYKSNDNGEKWDTLEIKCFTYFIRNINDTLYISCGPSIFYSTNDGNTWIENIINCQIVSFYKNNNLMLVGTSSFGNGVLFSFDEGFNWTIKNKGIDTTLNMTSFSRINDYYFCSGGSLPVSKKGSIYRTTYDKLTNVSVNDSQELLEFVKIIPNPASNRLILFISDLVNNSPLSIFNIYGQKVYDGVIYLHEKEIDISHLPVGIYYVRVGNRTAMFVKM